jgi:hypothetical protein
VPLPTISRISRSSIGGGSKQQQQGIGKRLIDEASDGANPTAAVHYAACVIKRLSFRRESAFSEIGSFDGAPRKRLGFRGATRVPATNACRDSSLEVARRLSDDEAEQKFRAKNPKVETTRPVKSVSGRYERSWVKNVVGIGNSSGFVEPLESTSLGVICDESDSLVNSLIECNCRPTLTIVRQYNKRFALKWDNIRDFLSVHYTFNTGLDTPFWRECRDKCDLADAAEVVEYYQENGPAPITTTRC